MLALAVGRVAIPGRRRLGVAGRSVVAHVHPQSAGLGAARAPDQAPSPACRRRAPFRRPARSGPSAATSGSSSCSLWSTQPAMVEAVDDDAVARVDAAQAVTVGCGRSTWTPSRGPAVQAPATPRAIGRLGAAAWKIASHAHAGQLGPHMPDHLEARRHVLELLGDVLADQAQTAAARGAAARLAICVMVSAASPRVDAPGSRAAGGRAVCGRSVVRWRRRHRARRDRRRTFIQWFALQERDLRVIAAARWTMPKRARRLRSSCNLSLSTMSLSKHHFGVALLDHSQQTSTVWAWWSRWSASSRPLLCPAFGTSNIGGTPEQVHPVVRPPERGIKQRAAARACAPACASRCLRAASTAAPV